MPSKVVAVFCLAYISAHLSLKTTLYAESFLWNCLPPGASHKNKSSDEGERTHQMGRHSNVDSRQNHSGQGGLSSIEHGLLRQTAPSRWVKPLWRRQSLLRARNSRIWALFTIFHLSAEMTHTALICQSEWLSLSDCPSDIFNVAVATSKKQSSCCLLECQCLIPIKNYMCCYLCVPSIEHVLCWIEIEPNKTS